MADLVTDADSVTVTLSAAERVEALHRDVSVPRSAIVAVRAVPDGMAISQLEPDPKSQALKLAGIARSFKNLRIFMEHLEESKYFTDIYLTSQGDAKLSDNTRGISFNLTCKVKN